MDNIRGKRLVLISHCILNQNSVVEPLARAKGSFSFVKTLIDDGVGIIQLPCPEFRHLGITRKPMEKHDYDTEEFRELSRKLFQPILEDLLIYLENGYEFCGIIGINHSPSCSITDNKGVFMEEVFSMLATNGIESKHFEVPTNYNNFYGDKELDIKL